MRRLVTVLALSFALFSADALALSTGNPKAPKRVSGVIEEIQILERIDAQQIICVAMSVYHEARGLSDESQFAIAHVVMNRARLEGYPPMPCGVVWQSWAFSWTKMKTRSRVLPHELEAWEKAQRIAYNAYMDPDVYDPTYGATHFHITKYRPSWAKEGYDRVRIEVHTFMKVAN